MLIQANPPTCIWPFSVKHEVYVRNRVPHSKTGEPPLFPMTDKKPNLKNLRVFGCAAYILKLPEGSKFEARATEGILLEVLDHGVYKVLVRYDDDWYSIVESRHVKFDETRFPRAPNLAECMEEEVSDNSTWPKDMSATESSCDDVDQDCDDVPTLIGSKDEYDFYEDRDDCEDNPDGTENGDEDEEQLHGNAIKDKLDEDLHDAHGTETTENSTIPDLSNKNRYPSRLRKPPSNWYASASVSTNEIAITTGDEPTLTEAIHASAEEREAWLNAIDEEFKSIEDNDTWELDDEPDGVPLPTHPVLHVKRDADGDLERFKARIFSGVNHQVYGQDYSEIYSPVAEFSLVRVFLYIVLSLRMFIAQVDIKTAFLNGVLEENLWVKSPRGIPGRPSYIYKLKRHCTG